MKCRNLCFILISFLSVFVLARTIEKTIATVDDEMIFLSELKSYRKLLASSLAPSGVLFQLRTKKDLIKSRKKLIDFMIDERVLKSQLPEGQFSSSKEEILRKELKRRKISYKNLKRKLLKIGFSLNQYQDILYYNDLFEKWIQTEIASTTQVLDTDINDYYRLKTGKDFFKQYKYNLNQWKFDFNQKGKSEAQEFSKQAKRKNASAQKVSLTEKQMNSVLRKIISKINVGQFSEPVCFGAYCYVFELLQKSFLITNQRETEKLRSKIFQERFLSKLKNWMEDKRKASIIRKYT